MERVIHELPQIEAGAGADVVETATGQNCGQCMWNDVQIVPLVDGMCPRCGADYTKHA